MFLRLLRDRSGNVLPIFAIALVPLLVVTGGVVDFNRAYDQRTVVQDAMDNAALAAGKQIGILSTDAVKEEAVNFFNANVAGRVEHVPVLTPTVNAATVDITTTLNVDTYFLGLIGLNQFTFNLHSQVTQAMGTLEVVMALDNSGSMTGTKISTLISAANSLADTLYGLGATSTKPDPVKVGIVPFAGSVNVDPANRNSGWMDTTGVNPYHGENFETATGSPPVSSNSPAVNIFDLYDSLSGTANAWAGCVEERPAPYDVQDDAASVGTPKTMFVPTFAPDEPDSWTCTTSSADCNFAGTTNGTRRYVGAQAGTFGYNNYLPDASGGSCGSPFNTVTMTKAAPAVFSKTSHGLTAGTEIVFNTTNTLYTGVTKGQSYYVATVPTSGSFTVTAASSATNVTISSPTGTAVTISNAKPAVFTASGHGLAVGNTVTFTTSGTLPSGLSVGTTYYVASVPSSSTFTVSATSGATTLSSISKASPGVLTTSGNHGLSVGDPVVLTTSGTLPSPLSAGTTYYVKTVPTSKTFTVASTSGGTAINTTSNGSGTHGFRKLLATSSAGSGTHRFFQDLPVSTFTTTANHGLAVGDALLLKTTGTLPSPFTNGSTYYVVSVPTTKTFTLSDSSGGAGIVGTGTQSGTHSFLPLVTTTGSQSGTHNYALASKTAEWTCQSGSAGCGGTGIGQSEQTALLGKSISSDPLCKYGTPANKGSPVSIMVDISGYSDNYAGGPNLLCTTKALQPLTTTKETAKSKISEMIASGATNITSGLMWGWRVLSPTAPFAEGRSYATSDNKKILILMTDGQNTYEGNSKFVVSQYGAWGYVWKSHLGTTSTNENDVQDKMDERTALACVNIKAAGIEIYTVAFQVSDAATLSMLRTCATQPDMAFQSSNNAALLAAFTAIGERISLLRLAR